MSLRSIPIGSNGYSAKSIGVHSTLAVEPLRSNPCGRTLAVEPYKLTLVWSTLVGSTLVVDRNKIDRNNVDQNKTDHKAGFKKAIISHSQFKRIPLFLKMNVASTLVVNRCIQKLHHRHINQKHLK
jgi:hypothetical protein